LAFSPGALSGAYYFWSCVSERAVRLRSLDASTSWIKVTDACGVQQSVTTTCISSCGTLGFPVALVATNCMRDEMLCECANDAEFYPQDLISCAEEGDLTCPTPRSSGKKYAVYCTEDACESLNGGYVNDTAWLAAAGEAEFEWHMG